MEKITDFYSYVEACKLEDGLKEKNIHFKTEDDGELIHFFVEPKDFKKAENVIDEVFNQ